MIIDNFPFDKKKESEEAGTPDVVRSPARGMFTQKNPRTLPKKIRKNPKIVKNPKNPTIFGGIY
jgi:hypothetical protein